MKYKYIFCLKKYTYYKMCILVTGAAGFIGSNVANHLFKKGKDIIVLDKIDICSSLKNLEKGIVLIKGNICNSDLVNHILVEYKIEVIIHFAAETHVDNSFGNSIKFTESNVLLLQHNLSNNDDH